MDPEHWVRRITHLYNSVLLRKNQCLNPLWCLSGHRISAQFREPEGIIFLSENTTMYICLLARMEPEVHYSMEQKNEGGVGDKRE